MLNSVSRTTGRTQLGFLTMSSNVAFGEKNTPVIRPTGLIAGCASGTGRDVVAISISSTTGALYGRTATAFYSALRRNATENFSAPVGAQHRCALARRGVESGGFCFTLEAVQEQRPTIPAHTHARARSALLRSSRTSRISPMHKSYAAL